jgi:hypothetical protein
MSGRGHGRFDTVGLVTSLGAVAALATTVAFTFGPSDLQLRTHTPTGFSADIHADPGRNPDPRPDGDTDVDTQNAGTITFELEEHDGTTTCNSTNSGARISATNSHTSCTIHDLVGTLDQLPGGTAPTSTLVITNGGGTAVFVASMVTSTCTVSTASDDSGHVGSDNLSFCGKVDVTIGNTTRGAAKMCVFPTQETACPALSNRNTLAGLATTNFRLAPLSMLAPGASDTYDIKVQVESRAPSIDEGLSATVPISWSISQ